MKMELFEPSATWLLALGKAIFHGSWIGFLILSVLKLLFLLVSHRKPALRYSASLISLLVLTGAFVILFFTFYQPVPPTVASMEYPDMAEMPEFRLLSLFSYLYLTGLTIMMLHTFLSIRSAYLVRKSGSPADPRWMELLERLKAQLGIRRSIDIRVTGRITSPGITGLISPVILVPASVFTNLSVHQVEIILAHELYHIRRYDHVIHIVQLFIETLLFFHPAVWIISGMVRSEREHCIDDRVLQWCRRPTLYSRALYELASEGRRLAALIPASESQRGYQLARRIQRIHNATMMKHTFRDKIHVLAFLLAAAVLLLTTVSFSTPASSQISIYSQISEDLPTDTYQDTIPDTGQLPSVKHREPDVAPPEAAEKAAEPEPLQNTESSPAQVSEPEPPQEPEHARTQDHEFELDTDHDFDLDTDHDFDLDMEMDFDDLENHMDLLREELEGMDWDMIIAEAEKGVEAARKEMEKIDWEQIKAEAEEELEAARREMESIDWESLKADMKRDLEISTKEMEHIDWDEIRKEIERGMENAVKQMERIDSLWQ